MRKLTALLLWCVIAMTPDVECTRLLPETLACDTKIIVHEGSSSSSKTVSLAQAHMVWSFQEANQIYSIVRATMPAMKRGALRDWKHILEWADATSVFSVNKTDWIFTNMQTGTQIEFFSLDNEQKARGPRRNRLWINEANEVTYDNYRQLSIRTSGTACLDYNPSMQKHWIYDHVLTRGDCTHIHSTYKDNAFLTREQIREVEVLVPVYEEPDGTRHEDWDLTYEGRGLLVDGDPYQWSVFGLGLRGSPSEAIYPLIYDAPFPQETDSVLGLDFGYNHPMVLVRVTHHDEEGHPHAYIDQLIHESYLKTDDLISLLPETGVSKTETIYADGSRPETIKALIDAGYNVKPADRTPGSVYQGIQYMKGHKLFFSARSQRTKMQFYDYRWKKKADGVVIDEPVKLNDDACFASGTLVMTDKGEIPIEKIQVGDKVLTRQGLKKVCWAGKTRANSRVYAYSMPNNRTLFATANHPVFTYERGFVPIETLMQSDTLVHAVDNSLQRISMRRQKHALIAARQNKDGKIGPVYNLAIEDSSEFFAEGVLVHNCDAVRYGLYSHWGNKAPAPRIVSIF